jgi:hypothetical protein
MLKQGGYQVAVRGREVEIEFATPTLGDAASDPELGGERRRFVVKGVVEGDVVRLTPTSPQPLSSGEGRGPNRARSHDRATRNRAI